MNNHNPIIAALDVPDAASALELAEQLAPVVGAFKIGKELFVAEGPDIVRRVRDTGAAVFLDLKFHDIPNTVAKAVASAARLNVQMLTVHASGGTEMLRAAQAAADDAENTPLILGVTVLTSMNEADLTEIGIQKNPAQQVQHLATLATAAGLKGLVCSPKEITPLRAILPPKLNSSLPASAPPAPTPATKKESSLPLKPSKPVPVGW